MAFCPYHGIEHPEATGFSDEHVIPFAAGGSDELVIRVCKEANERVGSEVDGPFLNSPLIASERARSGLRGGKGAVPVVEIHGHVSGPGGPIAGKLIYDGQERRFVEHPVVTRVDLPDGTQQITIECSEDQLPEIIANINRKQQRKGGPLITDAHVRAGAVGVDIERPSFEGATKLYTRDFDRALLKIALGSAHYLLEDAFSASPPAARLREYLWEPDPRERDAMELNAYVWPEELDDPKTFAEVWGYRDCHVVAVANSHGWISCSLLLFGKYHAFVGLTEDVKRFEGIVPPDDGVVLLVDPRDRVLRRLGLHDYLERRGVDENQVRPALVPLAEPPVVDR